MMAILASTFTRNLVFFGSVATILGILFLYGFTQLINRKNNKKQRTVGALIMIVAFVLIAVDGILSKKFAIK